MVSGVGKRKRHRVLLPLEQRRIDKARTDIRDSDVPAFRVHHLTERLEVVSLESFCRGVGGRGAQTARCGYGADRGDLSAGSLTAEQRDNGINAADKAGGIGIHGVHFDLRIELNIFVTDSGCVNIEIHTADFRREV